MWLHFLLFFSLCLISYIFPPKRGAKNKAYLFLTFVLLFIIAAFRAYNVGNDTGEYLRNFLLVGSSDSLSSIFLLLRYEPGYIMLSYVVSHLTGNYTVMLCMVSGFYLFSVLRFLNKYSKDIRLFVLMFFAFSLFYNVMIIQRQCLAIAVFLFAFDYLVARKPIKYFLLIGLAATFHLMSLVLIILYFAPKANFSRLRDVGKWFAIVGSVIIGFDFLLDLFLRFFPYYSHYFDSTYSVGGVRSASVALFAVRIICVIILLLVGGFKNFYYKEEKVNNVLLQIMMIDLLCSFAAIGFNLYDRVEGYFTLGLILFCVNMSSGLSNSKNRVICKFVLVIVPMVFLTAMLIGRSNWYGLFPYSFFWQT